MTSSLSDTEGLGEKNKKKKVKGKKKKIVKTGDLEKATRDLQKGRIHAYCAASADNVRWERKKKKGGKKGKQRVGGRRKDQPGSDVALTGDSTLAL